MPDYPKKDRRKSKRKTLESKTPVKLYHQKKLSGEAKKNDGYPNFDTKWEWNPGIKFKITESDIPPKDIKKQDHYTQYAIQPAEFIAANDLDFFAGNIVKYVCRYKLKNGVEDLQKARHYIDMLIEKVETGKVSL